MGSGYFTQEKDLDIAKLCSRNLMKTARNEIIATYEDLKFAKVFNSLYPLLHNKEITQLTYSVCKRLKQDCGLDVFPVVFRTGAGYWMRAAGEFMWIMYDKDLRVIGSQDTLKAINSKLNYIEASFDRGDTVIDAYSVKLKGKIK